MNEQNADHERRIATLYLPLTADELTVIANAFEQLWPGTVAIATNNPTVVDIVQRVRVDGAVKE
jgi:hypothetical protein